VSLYIDSGALQLAKHDLKKGLPGPPKRVGGIGSAAYDAIGASSDGIHFAVGTYVVSVTLSSTAAPLRSTAPVDAAAKPIAVRLQARSRSGLQLWRRRGVSRRVVYARG
jgi:methylaspartate ammonia-lyase